VIDPLGEAALDEGRPADGQHREPEDRGERRGEAGGVRELGDGPAEQADRHAERDDPAGRARVVTDLGRPAPRRRVHERDGAAVERAEPALPVLA
jgi:hypothetical protein